MTILSVNMNVAALLRNRRGHPWPDVLALAKIALNAGAGGLTLHPRPDERHATPDDARQFRKLISEAFPDRELNVEGYPDARFLKLVEEVKPKQVTLVPDDPEQATSDHGWAFREDRAFLTPIIDRLRRQGFRVALFAAAVAQDMVAAAATGADRVELYTGPYGAAHGDAAAAQRQAALIADAAHAAQAAGLGVNAGHDLTVPGTRDLLSTVPEIAEVSIGHALACDALTHGFADTVKRYLGACKPAA